MHDFDVRVGAYAVIIRRGAILLTHFNAPEATGWTLPGGGLEAGEDGERAAQREVLEETGFRVALERLLGVDSAQIPASARIDGRRRHLHFLRLIYRARVVAGTLRREVGGSTDDVCWFELREVPSLERVDLVDIGVRLWRADQGRAEH